MLLENSSYPQVIVLPSSAAVESPTAQILLSLARSDPEKFSSFFARMRQVYPEEITRACLRHVALSELNGTTREMAAWLARNNGYLRLLFDPAFLSLELARRGLRIMREIDEGFLKKLSRALDETREASFLIRALGLLEKSEDYEAFCLRLCTLTWHPDPRIRSKAVLALCRIRPNRPVIERHMESDDARVRANAVEALWHTGSSNASRLLREALTDTHHRVVVNGVLGLYYTKDDAFYSKILELAGHAGPNFRLALAWALGQMDDCRATTILETLQRDSSAEVRAKAAASVEALARQHVLQLDSRQGTRA